MNSRCTQTTAIMRGSPPQPDMQRIRSPCSGYAPTLTAPPRTPSKLARRCGVAGGRLEQSFFLIARARGNCSGDLTVASAFGEACAVEAEAPEGRAAAAAAAAAAALAAEGSSETLAAADAGAETLPVAELQFDATFASSANSMLDTSSDHEPLVLRPCSSRLQRSVRRPALKLTVGGALTGESVEEELLCRPHDEACGDAPRPRARLELLLGEAPEKPLLTMRTASSSSSRSLLTADAGADTALSFARQSERNWRTSSFEAPSSNFTHMARAIRSVAVIEPHSPMVVWHIVLFNWM
mmetsp:Transcript_69600/g.176574  ORF Transcript_69600/g.176574 Transcript_69600/m.176574 type:complete len:297 (+) Transcript_69600:2-892(+)